MPVVFAIGEYEILHFLAVMQFNSIENHKSSVFLVSGKFFVWELFLVATCIYMFLKKQVFPRRVQRKWISSYFLT